jgi:hypothetical protein
MDRRAECRVGRDADARPARVSADLVAVRPLRCDRHDRTACSKPVMTSRKAAVSRTGPKTTPFTDAPNISSASPDRPGFGRVPA